ncbi:hypothetical protein K1719_038244 [Acacia pycnantha]|nr:hypothetical protein K1719_038244 [Acacia pycnantha]
MDKSFKLLLLISSFIIVMANNADALVPAIYVFGDSTVDAGNNNFLKTPAKADKWPYGIDLNNTRGRFTNGKNAADFIAMLLDLPMPPPYLSLSEVERSRLITGINYGSGSCGILNTTRAGECLSLGKQIEYFTSTATIDLPKAIKMPPELRRHLAKSMYLLLIGSNDYNNYVNNGVKNIFTPQDFAQYLVEEMTNHIKKLYDVGARKFLVSTFASCEPKTYAPESCESNYYAEKLVERLQELQANLFGSLFTTYDGRKLFARIHENPKKFGITNLDVPCCEDGSIVCANRSEYKTFDKLGHPTEAIYKIVALDCFNGSTCLPLSLSQLANAPSFVPLWN